MYLNCYSGSLVSDHCRLHKRMHCPYVNIIHVYSICLITEFVHSSETCYFVGGISQGRHICKAGNLNGLSYQRPAPGNSSWLPMATRTYPLSGSDWVTQDSTLSIITGFGLLVTLALILCRQILNTV